jgi:hypothetical protein
MDSNSFDHPLWTYHTDRDDYVDYNLVLNVLFPQAAWDYDISLAAHVAYKKNLGIIQNNWMSERARTEIARSIDGIGGMSSAEKRREI